MTLRNALDGRLDARLAHYFMQVLGSGSVRGAADVLGVDPSVVSRAIGALEQECGARLLERRGRGVQPTDAGTLVADYLRRQQSQKQQLLEQLESIQKVQRGHVDLMAGEGFVDWLMQHVLRDFMTRYPAITVDLSIGRTDEIARQVVEDRAHVGIAFQPPKDGRIRSHYAHPYPIHVIVLATHPLARLATPLALADLLPYRGVAMHHGFGLQQHIEAAQTVEGVRLNTVFTTSSFNAMSHFVLSGLGYALSSRLLVTPQAPRVPVVMLPMQNSILSQGQVHVISRHGRMLPPAASILLDAIVRGIDSYTLA